MLADVLGFDDLDLVIELIAARENVVVQEKNPVKKTNGISGRLQTRREREAALNQQDFEHKKAALGPGLDRDGPQYPHVYKVHEAGNTLSVGGKRYALPFGSQTFDREVPATLLLFILSNSRLTYFAEVLRARNSGK